MARNRGEPMDLKGKLSRKIAELTMVVHLLFTRNHEREVEIDALKSVYGQQMKAIEDEVQGKVCWLEGQLEDLEKCRVLLDLRHIEIEKHKQQIQVLTDKEADSRRTLEEKEHLLGMAEKEIIKLREQLMSGADNSSAQFDNLQKMNDELEQVKKENERLNSKVTAKMQKLKNYHKQIDELQTKEANLERELQEALAAKKKFAMQLDSLHGDWQGELERLQISIAELTESQKVDQESIGKLEWKNKQLQQLNKELEDTKRQLSYQVQQLINEKNRKRDPKNAKPKQQTPEVPRSTPAYERDDELERLRREVQRYRLEIKNRESNFNRVFAEKSPVVVGARGKKSSTSISPDVMFPNLTGSRSRSSTNGQISPASYLPSLR